MTHDARAKIHGSIYDMRVDIPEIYANDMYVNDGMDRANGGKMHQDAHEVRAIAQPLRPNTHNLRANMDEQHKTLHVVHGNDRGLNTEIWYPNGREMQQSNEHNVKHVDSKKYQEVPTNGDHRGHSDLHVEFYENDLNNSEGCGTEIRANGYEYSPTNCYNFRANGFEWRANDEDVRVSGQDIRLNAPDLRPNGQSFHATYLEIHANSQEDEIPYSKTNFTDNGEIMNFAMPNGFFHYINQEPAQVYH